MIIRIESNDDLYSVLPYTNLLTKEDLFKEIHPNNMVIGMCDFVKVKTSESIGNNEILLPKICKILAFNTKLNKIEEKLVSDLKVGDLILYYINEIMFFIHEDRNFIEKSQHKIIMKKNLLYPFLEDIINEEEFFLNEILTISTNIKRENVILIENFERLYTINGNFIIDDENQKSAIEDIDIEEGEDIEIEEGEDIEIENGEELDYEDEDDDEDEDKPVKIKIKKVSKYDNVVIESVFGVE